MHIEFYPDPRLGVSTGLVGSSASGRGGHIEDWYQRLLTCRVGEWIEPSGVAKKHTCTASDR